MAFKGPREVVSQSLLDSVKFPPSSASRRRIKKYFSLGMEEFGDPWSDVGETDSDDAFQPTKKKTKINPEKACVKPTTSRFAAPTTSDQLEKLSKGGVPKNTQKNDAWAQKTFVDWMHTRNSSCSEDPCPQDVLLTSDAVLLDKWLSLFTIEVRRKDGSEYPPTTIHMLLCGLQRIMCRESEQPFEIFAKGDVRFRNLHGTMESVFQQLHKKGVGTVVKHASAISDEEENHIWQSGIVGDHSPTDLLRAVFYLNGINFSLRGGKEHRDLKRSQLTREVDHWKYVENGSKCFRGGVADLHRENKVVCQYPLPEKERCHVRLLDLYTSKLPKDTNNNFYCTPLKNIPLDPTKPWFSATPVGWNKLDSMVATIFKDAGISGKTNHSLRVTGATHMYNNGIPEKTIQSRTGHKSVEALRVYERPNKEQQAKACRALACTQTTPVPTTTALSDVTNSQASAASVHVGGPSMPVPWGSNQSNVPHFTFNNCNITMYNGSVTQQSQYALTQEQLNNFADF